MEKIVSNRSAAILGGLLGISLVVSSFILSTWLSKIRAEKRYIAVRGLAEQEVEADIAIWPIRFATASDDLTMLQQNIEKYRSIIRIFLTKEGFSTEEISDTPPAISDRDSERYPDKRKHRYASEAAVILRSRQVKAVEQARQHAGVLLENGVTLLEEKDWGKFQVEYRFTKLNDIKPAMIQEATLNALKAANQFALDSGSKIGKIRSASQGFFSIEDTAIPIKKKVRVVTQIEYFLKD